MAAPFLLVQLSDPHIGARWAGGDPVASLIAAVDAVRALPQSPDAVLVSGDLADNAADAEYERVRELLAPLAVPIHVLPGNHDDRDAIQRHFGVPGEYAVDLGPLRLVALDTTVPGEDGGRLDEVRLAWLDEQLAAEPEKSTLVAMHHPPLATGIPAQDEIGLPAADRHALGAIVARHPQVSRLVGGHFHRVIVAELGGRAVLSVPSTYVQAGLDFRAGPVELGPDPAGFVVHALVDGELISHVQPVV